MSAMEIVQTMNYDDTNVAETLKRSLSEIAISFKVDYRSAFVKEESLIEQEPAKVEVW